MSAPAAPALEVVIPCPLRAVATEAGRRRLRFRGLESLLANAALDRRDISLETCLARLAGLVDERAPAAALRHATTAPDEARSGYWLCADPVLVHLSVDNAYVTGRSDDASPDEAAAIIGMLNAEFGRDGLRFVADTPSRWHVRCDTDPDIETVPLWRAIGHPVRGLLPAGAGARRWSSRLNEVQMLLHAHPVNTAREGAGAQRIDSVWWWGEGRWPRFGAPAIDVAAGGPIWFGTACEANGVGRAPVDFRFALQLAVTGRRVAWSPVDWEAAAAVPFEIQLARWDEEVFEPLATALAARKVARATLWFDDAGRALRAHRAERTQPLARRWLRMIGREPAPPPLWQVIDGIPS